MAQTFTESSTTQLNSWAQTTYGSIQSFNQTNTPPAGTYDTTSTYTFIWNLLGSTTSFNGITGTWGGL
tara:strand:+ start:289 stop:492 length:204 start_codon:yes stop_codon:yes gene_type:complete